MIVLYDADCGVCSAVAGWFAARTQTLTYRPYQMASRVELARLGVTARECAAALQLIDESGRRSGARAINALLALTRHPLRHVAALAESVPILRRLEERAYGAFAARRQAVSRLLGLGVCRLAREN